MIAKDEEKRKLAAKPCADCAVDFAKDKLDDDGLCVWCALIRNGACPAFTKSEREADEWLKANPGRVLTDEWAEQEELRQLEAALKKCSECTSEYLITVKMRLDGRCFECQNTPMGWTRKGRIRGMVKAKNAEGLSEALTALRVSLRYNTRANRAEMQHNGAAWQPFNDRIVAKLREVLAENFVYLGPPGKDGGPGESKALRFGRDSWADVLNVLLYGVEVDPFIQWLAELPQWDEHPRLEKWLPQVFTIYERLPLAAWAGRHLFLGAVWRAYQPGTKFDEFPVLIGKGGLGKSTAARFLLPADRDEWFSDGLNLAADSKVRAEALQGRVVVEVGDMQGSTRADLESLKVFLSRTDDGAVRLAYRKDPELLLRRCVVVGTADRKEPLPNDNNLRRFVPVYLDGGSPDRIRYYLDYNRIQLWAEALHLYRQGVEARLPEHLKGMQAEATDQARSRDTVVEDAVSEWVEHNDGFTMAELACGIRLIDSNDKGARLQMRDQHRLGKVLESLSYEKRRDATGGRRVMRWFRG